jgi:hypothetical protein
MRSHLLMRLIASDDAEILAWLHARFRNLVARWRSRCMRGRLHCRVVAGCCAAAWHDWRAPRLRWTRSGMGDVL